jgi:hypothetical protein
MTESLRTGLTSAEWDDELHPKVAMVEDSEGCRWVRTTPSMWTMAGTKSGYTPSLSAVQLREFYGPITIVRVLGRVGAFEEYPEEDTSVQFSNLDAGDPTRLGL